MRHEWRMSAPFSLTSWEKKMFFSIFLFLFFSDRVKCRDDVVQWLRDEGDKVKPPDGSGMRQMAVSPVADIGTEPLGEKKRKKTLEKGGEGRVYNTAGMQPLIKQKTEKNNNLFFLSVLLEESARTSVKK